MTFIPFDIKCYNKLYDKFQYLFETELINEICKHGRLKQFKEGETLIDIGTLITHMPLVIQGSIKVMTEDEQGDELLLYFLEYGETCAVTLNCCTRAKKSSIRAIAETDGEVLFIPVQKMEDWMVSYKSWRAFVLDSFNERLNEMLGAIDSLVFRSLEERLKKYLHDKAWVNKTGILQVSHAEIAHDLHTSRVVISRLMKRLEQEEFIKQSRNRVVVSEFAPD